MFGPSFSQFNAGSRRGVFVPAPIIPMASGHLLVASHVLTHAEMLVLQGTPVQIVRGTAGYIIVPVRMVIQKPTPFVAYNVAATVSLEYQNASPAPCGSPAPRFADVNPGFAVGGPSATNTVVNVAATITGIVGSGIFITDNGGVKGLGAAANRMIVTIWYVRVRSEF